MHTRCRRLLARSIRTRPTPTMSLPSALGALAEALRGTDDSAALLRAIQAFTAQVCLCVSSPPRLRPLTSLPSQAGDVFALSAQGVRDEVKSAVVTALVARLRAEKNASLCIAALDALRCVCVCVCLVLRDDLP